MVERINLIVKGYSSGHYQITDDNHLREHGPDSFDEVAYRLMRDIVHFFPGERDYRLSIQEEARKSLSKEQIGILEGMIELNNKISSARELLQKGDI